MASRRAETIADAFLAAMALHAGLLALASHFGSALPAGPERLVTVLLTAPPEPTPPAPEPLEIDRPAPATPPAPIPLGHDRGSPEADAWLGLDEATPHAARAAPVDQSAMDPSPGRTLRPPPAPARPAPPLPAPAEPDAREPAPSGEPADASPSMPARPLPAPPPATPTAPTTNPPGTTLAERRPASAETLALAGEPAPVALLPGASDVTLPPLARSTPPPQPAGAAPLRMPASPPAAPVTASAATDQPGPSAIPADAQSDATSREGAIDVRPGKVLAAKGLRVRTVRPRYTAATLLTARPRDAVVRVEFDAQGQVRDARFLPGRDTGYPEVDRALIESIYQWSAAGEALSRLASTDDRAAFTFRLLLR